MGAGSLVMSPFRIVRKKLGRINGKISHASRNGYYFRQLKKPLWDNVVVFESKAGKDIAGNIFYLIKELSKPEYSEYKAVLILEKSYHEYYSALFCKYGIKCPLLVRPKGKPYRDYLARGKYLFNDTTFPAWFIKREGQIYTNTWHGTPFKMMGRKVENRAYAIGNVQRNFLISDFLIYPNDYMKEKFFEDYMLTNLYKGRAMMSGYPRNSIFFDSKRGEQVKSELGLENKIMAVYMPTWRGTLTDKKDTLQLEDASAYFHLLDKKLSDNEVFYVKFHIFTAAKFKFEDYEHIRPIPEGYETYDLLNAADVLVTDYSSVFYDFANSRKKIVLFTYDRSEYLDERGLYVPIESFPFPRVDTVDELVSQIRSPKNYDDSAFIAQYCKYDTNTAPGKVLHNVFAASKTADGILEMPADGRDGVKCLKAVGNGRKNILVYCSNLARNGITTSLMNLISLVDHEKNNYYFSFLQSMFNKTPMRVAALPDYAGILPMSGAMTEKSVMETVAFKLYFSKNLQAKWIVKIVDRIFKREYYKKYGNIQIDTIVHFTGYAPFVTMMFLEADARKVIFVHNDMNDEIKEKNNQHVPTLLRAYKEFDTVAPVSEAVKNSLNKLHVDMKNVHVIENAHYYEGVLEKAKQPLALDSDTKINIEPSDLSEILDDDTKVKFITIGRFSEEKGHKKLIVAFDEFAEENDNAYLIIIGGYGDIYYDTVELAASMKHADRIIIIRAISNPFPILKKCSLFILPSDREPLGLVLLEADTLGIPIIATDIPGSGDFLKRYGGYLVDNSAKGLIGGMQAFTDGKVHPLNIRFDEYNKKIVEKFESVI